MKKEWRKVKDFENYLISNYGELFNEKSGQLLKPRVNKDGYIYYRLSKSGGIQKDFRAHRLVAMAFIPNENNLETVNHIDGDKTNNRQDNLEWMDRSSQLYHAYRLGLKKPIKGKCSEKTVKYIRDKYDNHKGSLYGFFAELSRELNMSQTAVTRIARRKNYCDI